MPESISLSPKNLPLERAGYPIHLVAFLVYANSFISLFRAIDTVGEGQLLPLYRPFSYITFDRERKLWLPVGGLFTMLRPLAERYLSAAARLHAESWLRALPP